MCPIHGPRCLSLDLITGERSWICGVASHDNIAPVRQLTCLSEVLTDEISNDIRHEDDPMVIENNSEIDRVRGVPSGIWPAPRERIESPINSWLYMPLFLDASNLLHIEDQQSWRSHPTSLI